MSEGETLREMALRAIKAQEASDEAIKRAEDHAHVEWLADALDVVHEICVDAPAFTTDEVWERLRQRDGARTHDPRAMGAVMRIVARNGWTSASDRYVKSVRPECHARPIVVWESRVWGAVNG